MDLEIDDRVLLRSIEMSKAEGRKVLKPRASPYKVKERLKRDGYVIKSKAGGRTIQAHAN